MRGPSKTPHADAFLERMRARWDEETRIMREYEEACAALCEKMWKMDAEAGRRMAETIAPPGALCKVDERLKP